MTSLGHRWVLPSDQDPMRHEGRGMLNAHMRLPPRVGSFSWRTEPTWRTLALRGDMWRQNEPRPSTGVIRCCVIPLLLLMRLASSPSVPPFQISQQVVEGKSRVTGASSSVSKDVMQIANSVLRHPSIHSLGLRGTVLLAAFWWQGCLAPIDARTDTDASLDLPRCSSSRPLDLSSVTPSQRMWIL